jgi:hypothetical protein
MPGDTFAVPMKNWTGNSGNLGYQGLKQYLRITLLGEACTLPGPKRKQLRSSGLIGRDGDISQEKPLQRVRENLHSWSIKFVQ